MPHAGPDWGTYAPVSTIYSIQDLGELAARLGSIVTFDRRGNVIFMDNFDDGIEPWSYGGTSGYSVRWSPYQYKSGGFSIELTTPAVAGKNAWIERYFPYPSKSRLGIEMSVNKNYRVNQIDFYFEIYDGSDLYEPYIRLIGNTWSYLGDDLNYHNLGSAGDLMNDIMFHTFKLVFDLTTGKFVRLIVDTTTFDLSTFTIYKINSSSSPSLFINFAITSMAYAEAAQAWVENLILTQNEP